MRIYGGGGGGIIWHIGRLKIFQIVTDKRVKKNEEDIIGIYCRFKSIPP